MIDFCEVCEKYIKRESKYKQLKSYIHKEFDKGRHNILTFENANINQKDSILYSKVTEHNKKIHFF